ncbi:cell division protein FtsZ [Oxynema sp. CENA135]|uniref:cell division protein FtsZ n=1 Tax=Oxynema sp. CENA135 TaxID=984206 RepID=UPI00190A6738|nr:cell division protein FtsZ [Oxynema sp. CENA135]
MRNRVVNIKAIGVGGGACNAINRAIARNLSGVEFIAVNTDVQALSQVRADRCIQIGDRLTQGLGTGGNAELGYKAADRDREKIADALKDSDLVFVTAAMGGGTGTGAAPVVAEVAKSMGALTVAVVTRPFTFEGKRRAGIAQQGIEVLQSRVDTPIAIANDKILSLISPDTPMQEAFGVADDILIQGIQGVSDIITIPGIVNVDFADVRSVMANAGSARLGIGVGFGQSRATDAVLNATSSPLLDASISGARGVVLNITGGNDLTLHEVHAAAEAIYEVVDRDANIIFGTVVDDRLDDEVRITVIATGFEAGRPQSANPVRPPVATAPPNRTPPVRQPLKPTLQAPPPPPTPTPTPDGLDLPNFRQQRRSREGF